MSSETIVSKKFTKVNYLFEKGGENIMPPEWICEIKDQMFRHRITAKRLAAEAGIHPKYLSAIFNCRARYLSPTLQLRLQDALQRILSAESVDG